MEKKPQIHENEQEAASRKGRNGSPLIGSGEPQARCSIRAIEADTQLGSIRKSGLAAHEIPVPYTVELF
ncbi:hypothetical protein SAMD00023353_1002610 [Rosellinia necatrix]|uniref:Uncharacterized protein n=1 Tax=Rosellinia necatrix TaxID=77044 RepID=A0A1S8A6D1_ROSNE|nr:hypothetical protein SAMD00023353_1002610 [Rosellinia necatrix]